MPRLAATPDTATTPADKVPALADLSCADPLECPVRRTALLIEGKWTTQIIRNLLGGKQRYSELLHGLPGISPKILAQRLKLLEQEGLLVKTIYAEVPPHTDYTLTPLGLQLRGVIEAMAVYGVALGQAARRSPAARAQSDR